MVTELVITAAPAALITITPEETQAIEVAVRTSSPSIALSSPGPQGASGMDGAPGAAYIHTQSAESALWTIAHNLGFRPTVAVTTVGGLEVVADVQHLSINTLTVSLVAPMMGLARLV